MDNNKAYEIMSVKILIKDIVDKLPSKYTNHHKEITVGTRTKDAFKDKVRIDKIINDNPNMSEIGIAAKVVELCMETDYHYKYEKNYF